MTGLKPRPFSPMLVQNDDGETVGLIPLTQGYVSVVDRADFEEVGKVYWCVVIAQGTTYAGRSILIDGRQQFLFLQDVIMRPEAGQLVDHKDGDGLNNRRGNLRICNRSQNAYNARLSRSSKTGLKGVSWDETRGLWRAAIKNKGKCIHLGYFIDPIEAAKAYNAAALFYAGEFARINEMGEEAK